MRNPPPEADAIGNLGVAPPRSSRMRLAFPIGISLHLGAGLALVHEGARFPYGDLPQFGAIVGKLVAPPAEGLRLGDSSAPVPDEIAPDETRRRTRRNSPDRNVLLAMLDRAPRAAPAPFGFEDGIPEGSLDGFPDGLPEGVRGGLPGGVPGGAIGSPNRDADPVLPPPDRPPVPILMPGPRFPEEAVRNGVRGRVVLRALITERGTVEVLRVLRSVPGLDKEAMRLVESEWRFRPAQRNGRPVPAISELVVRFDLR